MQGYVQGALRGELLMASFVERFKTSTLGKSHWYILPVLGKNKLKRCISYKFLPTEGHVEGPLQKEQHITPFTERFRITTLGKSSW